FRFSIMQKPLLLTIACLIAVAECASFRLRREVLHKNRQIDDMPVLDDDQHTWNHPWHKSFAAAHSSHGDIAIFGRFRSETDDTMSELTPVVPDVSHTNRQLAPDQGISAIPVISGGSLMQDRVATPTDTVAVIPMRDRP
ncbi:hypothetical protein PFISCL1PPCAC_16599, partial [Pristionchus fissidentatus]